MTDERNFRLLNEWCNNGCPGKVTFHLKPTGETGVMLGGEVRVGEGHGTESQIALNAQYEGQEPLPSGEIASRRVEAPVTLTRKCKVCRGEIVARRESARFYSARCRVQAQRARKQGKAKELLDGVCLRRAG